MAASSRALAILSAGHHAIVPRQYRPQRMKHPDGARLPGAVWLAWSEDARRPHQRERRKAAGDQLSFHLAFDPVVKSTRLWESR